MPKLLICTVCLLLACLLAMLNGCPSGQGHDPSAAAVANNSRVVYANLIEWARTNGGLYPEQLGPDQLKDSQNKSIVNPYSGSEVFPVAFGADPATFGNVCYIPIHEGQEVTGFILLGFGNTAGSGEDVDGDGRGDNVVVRIFSDKLGDADMQKYLRDMQ